MRSALAAIPIATVAACGAAAGATASSAVAVRPCSDRGEGRAPLRQFSGRGDVGVGRVAFRGLRHWSSRKALLRAQLNGLYFAKATAIVRTGAPVTITIAPADRRIAALVFVRGLASTGLGIGVPSVRLVPCAPGTRAFAYKGTVGRLTMFPGGFVVTRPACVHVLVQSGKAKPVRRTFSFGAGTCRAA